MNNLSWFIYLTQVVDGLNTAGGFVLVAGMIVALLAFIFAPILLDEFDLPHRKILTVYGWIMFGALLISAFVPTRQTMILIAGSEIGERVAKSDGVQSVVDPGMNLIRKWIKQESDKIKDKS